MSGKLSSVQSSSGKCGACFSLLPAQLAHSALLPHPAARLARRMKTARERPGSSAPAAATEPCACARSKRGSSQQQHGTALRGKLFSRRLHPHSDSSQAAARSRRIFTGQQRSAMATREMQQRPCSIGSTAAACSSSSTAAAAAAAPISCAAAGLVPPESSPRGRNNPKTPDPSRLRPPRPPPKQP